MVEKEKETEKKRKEKRRAPRETMRKYQKEKEKDIKEKRNFSEWTHKVAIAFLIHRHHTTSFPHIRTYINTYIWSRGRAAFRLECWKDHGRFHWPEPGCTYINTYIHTYISAGLHSRRPSPKFSLTPQPGLAQVGIDGACNVVILQVIYRSVYLLSLHSIAFSLFRAFRTCRC